ncbi:FtsX-like permease family protein [Fulvivirga sp. RKSG066]|uniref:ABC transporter permease n=1 Tax=Fulvivirga aurantia TaxID=2529383 RepID=UPI0012BC7599|nr:ABC transporter permease [Fulvivirga aurantia]MTI21565.1 FtsX-like permease family protein [Fulvivirga aurantia]
MLRNILKISLRNFIKERFYGSINIFGLAMGIAASLLIVSYVVHETSYDKDYKDVGRLYRVNMTNIWMPEGGVWGSTIPPLAGVLATDYPEIEEVMRINTPGGNIMRVETQNEPLAFYEQNILGADSNFFSIFDFQLLYGNPETALKGLNKVVISKEMAIKYFDTEQALGKTILFGEKRTPLEVTAVTATQPTNRHFDFDFLISIATNPAFKQIKDTWIATQVVTYVKLKPEASAEQLEPKLADIAPTHAGAQMSRWGMEYEKFMSGKGDWDFFLQPVSDIHLHSTQIGNRLGSVSDGKYMYIFSFTAVFIMLLAIINFINLATARAAIRAKEIGVRKALGSMKRQLVAQFLLESVLMCFMAGVIALGLSEVLKIGVNSYMDSVFYLVDWHNPLAYGLIFGSLIIVGILAGLYPALYLTAFKPSNVLKGQMKTGQNSKWFRNTLVVLQFSISTALMICTFIVYQQLDFFKNKDLGYDKENIVVVNWADKLGSQLEQFQNEVLNHPDVLNASVSLDVIGRGSYEDVFRDKRSGHEQPIAMMKADERQLQTMGIELLHGRFFEKGNAADKQSVVINESTMSLFGYTEEDVLGQVITYAGDDIGPATVVGVVKDFNFYSLHSPIAPYLFYHIDASIWGSSRVLSVRSTGQNTRELISFLENKWNERVDAPFEFSFLDQEYAAQYRTEENLGVLFAVFTCIAMVIACLGLFGLASYTVGQKGKEIGIRKALGASVTNIMFQFNGRFTRLVLISLVVALPVAWWAMDNWLEQFVYRIEIAWWVFLVAAAAAVMIALLTVSYQSIKAALLNPVETLKDE